MPAHGEGMRLRFGSTQDGMKVNGDIPTITREGLPGRADREGKPGGSEERPSEDRGSQPWRASAGKQLPEGQGGLFGGQVQSSLLTGGGQGADELGPGETCWDVWEAD